MTQETKPQEESQPTLITQGLGGSEITQGLSTPTPSCPPPPANVNEVHSDQADEADTGQQGAMLPPNPESGGIAPGSAPDSEPGGPQ